VDLARGYSHPQLHNLSAKVSLDAVEALAEHEPLPLANCSRTAHRFRGNQFVKNETRVAAIRISTNGWEASVLHGLQVSCSLPTRLLACMLYCHTPQSELRLQKAPGALPDTQLHGCRGDVRQANVKADGITVLLAYSYVHHL